jgi:hypothetical protein
MPEDETTRGGTTVVEPTFDPMWQADYVQACRDVTALWAAAYQALAEELGDGIATALAPTVLPPVVAMAEQMAATAATERLNDIRERIWQEQAKVSPIDAFLPRQPW